MDITGLVLGQILAWLHWWLFEKFVLSLPERPNLLRIVVLSGGRWMLTVLLGATAVRVTHASGYALALGFFAASLAARVWMVLRHRPKLS